MKNLKFPIQSWLSVFAWELGQARWWFIACLVGMAFCIALTAFWNHESSAVDAEVEEVLQQIKSKRMVSRQVTQENRRGQANPVSVASSNYLSSEQEAMMEVRLPPIQATKASPLGKYLSESKLKDIALKQVDYVWGKSNKTNGAGLGVGRLEVNLNLEGSYIALRAWLGELLYEESNIQINAIQFQRLSRDSAVVNSVISLSVYFQEAK
jgi:hypothetical protein